MVTVSATPLSRDSLLSLPVAPQDQLTRWAVGYILAGVILGPSVLGLVRNRESVQFLAELGVLMLLYCLSRRLAGRMTAMHDIDIRNVALYWHFIAIKLLVTVATIAGFPLLA